MKSSIVKSVLPVVLAAAICTGSASVANAAFSCTYSNDKKIAFCSDDNEEDGTVWRCDKNKDGKTWRCGATPDTATAPAQGVGPKIPVDSSPDLSKALVEVGAPKLKQKPVAPSGGLAKKP